jgi:ketosteroid isomerase-like protein
VPSPAADPSALEAANAGFYERFEALDLDGMSDLWCHTDEVCCIHPGGSVIAGWGPVRRSWAVIFANTRYLQFIVTDVRVSVLGELGWVTCTENILTDQPGGGDDLGAGLAVATNLFTWREGGWRMLGHHASPVLREPG